MDEQGTLRPVERLADVFTSGDTSGEQLCKEVTESLQSINVDMQFIVGQGYDGAGNVRGKCQDKDSGNQSKGCLHLVPWASI